MSEREFVALCAALVLLVTVGGGSLIAYCVNRIDAYFKRQRRMWVRTQLYPPKGFRDAHGPITVRRNG